MDKTSKQIVLDTLEFKNTNSRVARQLWDLPWASNTYPNEIKALKDNFDWDFYTPNAILSQPLIKIKGDAYEVGEFTDEWGCVFTNVHRGIIGEVKHPLVDENDEEWESASMIHFPRELLSFDVAQVNKDIAIHKDKFIMMPCHVRPFERLQFIRGTEQLYMDLVTEPKGLIDFISKMHDFNCELMEKWCQTDIDAVFFMDDWGAQNSLLINPKTWEKLFMPLYGDYIKIAKNHGKKSFMHSDGNTLSIIPKLIDLGLDAINAQIFCIGLDELIKYRGKITFWGEIDRQNLLPNGTTKDIDNAVNEVYSKLWQNGGCIAQCEFGPGAKAENVRQVFESWSNLR